MELSLDVSARLKELENYKKIIFNYLLRASLRDKLLILAGSLAIPIALFYFLYIQSALERNNILNQEIATLKEEVQKLEARKLQVERLKSENKELEKILEAAMQLLPQKGQIPEVLSEISNLGSDFNLKFMTFKPEAEVQQDFYAVIPITLKIEGQFHNISSFFSKVIHLPRIVQINEYKMSVIPATQMQSQVLITVDCKASTYRFLTDQEIKARQTATKK